ncbi:MAG: sodium-independent anion transporter, partial [Yoonia sp.]|uniref:sodium-independent anion transporter n=1 Tax=Yoonia sp. TaxID=2212373 RepID=UPI003EF4BC11
CPQISILRLEGALFFGSVDHVESEFRRFEAQVPGQNVKILVLKGLGKIDLSGVSLLADEAAKARNAGGDYHIVVPFKKTVDALERMNLFEAFEKANLHPNKSEAIQAATAKVNDDICRTCKVRAFVECAGRPAPQGVPSKKAAPIREGSW